MKEKDKISLELPAKPEYLLAIRLTTSALSSRAGFDINDIEDIKVAVAEACIAIMNQKFSYKTLRMEYEICDQLCIHIIGKDQIAEENPSVDSEQTELSRYIIESLMDTVTFQNEGDKITQIDMEKRFNS